MQTDAFKAPGAVALGTVAIAGDATLNKPVTIKGALTCKNDFRGASPVECCVPPPCPACGRPAGCIGCQAGWTLLGLGTMQACPCALLWRVRCPGTD